MGLRGPRKQFTESYYARNREKCLAQTKEYQKKNRERVLWQAAKQRALAAGMDFDLNLEDIKIPDYCPVLDIPMVSPSLDRWDNTKGYLKDNVRVISKRANILKSNMTIEECEALLTYMKFDGFKTW